MGIGHAGSTDGWLATQSCAGISLICTDRSAFLFSQAMGSKNPRSTGGGAADAAACDHIGLLERKPCAVVEQRGGKNSPGNHVTRNQIGAFFC